MDKEHIRLECYRIYTETKERFIDRSFRTNKFYLVIEIVLLMSIAFVSYPQSAETATAILSGLGMLIAALWWFNHDSYEYLIKIKYRDVLEKLEAEMGVDPCTMEYKASKEDAEKRKVFVFGHAHKLISFLIFLTFLVFFITSAGPIIGGIFGAEVI